MIVPLGSIRGFSLQAEIREVAFFYGVDPDELRTLDGRQSKLLGLARHALYWKLTRQRRLSARRVAKLLSLTHSTVRDGALLHEQRIAEFRATCGIQGGRQ